jgi:uncharacterized membrane protein YraQ (UPF0718 family)
VLDYFLNCSGRPFSRPCVAFHPRVFAVFAAFALAAAVSPAYAIPRAAFLSLHARLAFDYWCSMILGASPFLTIGALTAAAARLMKRTSAAGLVVAAVFLPGCDCTMNAISGELVQLPSAVAAFVVTWGACCNPLALAGTYLILGPHVAWCRVLCGLVAATCTACIWQADGSARNRHDCRLIETFPATFVAALSRGLSSFSFASALACLVLACTNIRLSHESGIFAVVLGALLSPCSTADSLLARALFANSKMQLVFVLAAQCLDIRQAIMLARTFGPLKTISAVLSSAGACALGYAFA